MEGLGARIAGAADNAAGYMPFDLGLAAAGATWRRGRRFAWMRANECPASEAACRRPSAPSSGMRATRAAAVFWPTPWMATSVLTARDRRASVGQGLDVLIDGGELGVEAGDDGVETDVRGVGAGGRPPVGVGEPVGEDVAPGQDEGLQAHPLDVACAPEREAAMPLAPVAGERPRVDRVGLAEDAERADEGLDLAGVGAVGRDAGREQGGQKIALVAAGGLADDEAGRIKRGGELGQGLRLVGDRARSAMGFVEHDDAGLADIATDATREGRGGQGHLRLSFVGLGLSAGIHRLTTAPSTHQAVKEAEDDLDDDGREEAPLLAGLRCPGANPNWRISSRSTASIPTICNRQLRGA